MTPSADRELAQLMDQVCADLRLSRATLRLDVPGDQALPMTHESLAPGVTSLRGRVVAAQGAPTISRLMADREWVIVSDCATLADRDPLFDDEGFRAMLDDYGGLAAFIAAPAFDGDRLVAILSLHQLGHARDWSDNNLDTVATALERVLEIAREQSL